jgi:hypothetical protein
MSWAETMKEAADAAASGHGTTTDASRMRSATSAPWDPHEVWLTRVKRPREMKNSRADVVAENQGLPHMGR